MDAAIWTAIGLLAATSLGTLFYLGARIDGLAARMDSRFDAMLGVLETRFARVDARFDAVDARFARVDTRFDAVDARFARVDARFDRVDARFDTVESRLEAHLNRHAN